MPESHSEDLDKRRRRVLFRATHRGTHENDLMIGGFVRANLTMLASGDLDALEALLEHPDNDLADWLTGRRPIPDSAASPMLLRIREAVVAGCAVQTGVAGSGCRPQDQPLPGPAGFPTSAQ